MERRKAIQPTVFPKEGTIGNGPAVPMFFWQRSFGPVSQQLRRFDRAKTNAKFPAERKVSPRGLGKRKAEGAFWQDLHIDSCCSATLAGYGGPDFHIWPSGHINQGTYSKLLLRIQVSASAKKSFGAATGVSDPRLQKIQAPVCTLGPQATSIKRGIGNAVVD